MLLRSFCLSLTIVKTGFKSIFLEFFIVLHQSSKCVALLALYLNRKKVYTANGVVYHSESIEWVVGVKSEVLDKLRTPLFERSKCLAFTCK